MATRRSDTGGHRVAGHIGRGPPPPAMTPSRVVALVSMGLLLAACSHEPLPAAGEESGSSDTGTVGGCQRWAVRRSCSLQRLSDDVEGLQHSEGLLPDVVVVIGRGRLGGDERNYMFLNERLHDFGYVGRFMAPSRDDSA